MSLTKLTSQTRRSYVYLALCILTWASIPVTSKKALAGLDPWQFLFYSTVLSFLALGAVMLTRGKWRELPRYSIRQYGIMAGLGALGCYLYYVLLYAALARTTAAEGFILAYTWPILVLLLAVVILREPLTARKLVAILISFLGIIVIVTQGRMVTVQFTSLSGDLLALGGATAFALFSVLGKGYNFDQTIAVFVYFAAALMAALASAPFFSTLVWPSRQVWPWLIYNGLLVNGVSYIWWFKALEHGETHVISNALYLTPFVALVYIWLLLDEPIHASALVGLLIIVAGIGVQSVGARGGKRAAGQVGEG